MEAADFLLVRFDSVVQWLSCAHHMDAVDGSCEEALSWDRRRALAYLTVAGGCARGFSERSLWLCSIVCAPFCFWRTLSLLQLVGVHCCVLEMSIALCCHHELGV